MYHGQGTHLVLNPNLLRLWFPLPPLTFRMCPAGNYAPTPAHHFIKLLHDKGLLLRCFTQNIDSLEHQVNPGGGGVAILVFMACTCKACFPCSSIACAVVGPREHISREGGC
jgi:hypothetical protein